MTTTIIAGVIFVAGLCAGVFIFLYLAYFKNNSAGRKAYNADGTALDITQKKCLTFEWKYITLPLIIFFISFVIAAIFFFQLPDQVAYRFTAGGTAESWMGKTAITAIMLGLQLVIIVMVILIVKAIVGFGQAVGQTSPNFNPDRFMLLIGNIAALPQLVLAVIMFDIFSFNVVGEHVLSIWLIILILAISGAVILTAFFIKAFLQTRKSGK
ncbi:MAG: DUF1648 domain-containing protein [Dehalococcoidales bacterium]|jgi:uncharacterized membrane protein|nr:DUF1648 domain-containing protein [Dehalococcoidales bacterium]MDD3994789.1 DUF1648 domain-containing protein [Dehalococcoidales bacterium]NLT28807.1 DUF1648 domain-containing protein [Dehalococcoidales bacterium]